MRCQGRYHREVSPDENAEVERDAFEASLLAQLIVGRRQSTKNLEQSTQAIKSLIDKLEKVDIDNQTLEALHLQARTVHSILTSVVALSGRLHGEFAFGEIIRPEALDELRTQCTGRSVDVVVPTDEFLPRPSQLQRFTNQLFDWQQAATVPALDSLIYLRNTLGPGDLIVTAHPISELINHRRQQRMADLEKEAERNVAKIRQAAGTAGKERIAQTFADAAFGEEKLAKFWTRCVVGFTLVGVLLPVVVLSTDKVVFTMVTGLAGTIIKTLTCLPLFALAAYSGRIAAQHRDMYRHLKVLTAQIDSVNAYVTGLPTKLRDDILESLGKRAFADPGLVAHDEGKMSPIPEEVIKTLQKALETTTEALKKAKDKA